MQHISLVLVKCLPDFLSWNHQVWLAVLSQPHLRAAPDNCSPCLTFVFSDMETIRKGPAPSILWKFRLVVSYYKGVCPPIWNRFQGNCIFSFSRFMSYTSVCAEGEELWDSKVIRKIHLYDRIMSGLSSPPRALLSFGQCPCLVFEDSGVSFGDSHLHLISRLWSIGVRSNEGITGEIPVRLNVHGKWALWDDEPFPCLCKMHPSLQFSTSRDRPASSDFFRTLLYCWQLKWMIPASAFPKHINGLLYNIYLSLLRDYWSHIFVFFFPSDIQINFWTSKRIAHMEELKPIILVLIPKYFYVREI